MQILSGPLSSRWHNFVRLIVDRYPVQKVSTVGKLPIFIPLEMVGKARLADNSVIYVSTPYQMNQLSACLALNLGCSVAVNTEELRLLLANKGITSTVLPFGKYSDQLDQLLGSDIPIVSLPVKKEMKKIAYTVNATYQLEHLLPIYSKLNGDVFVPENQFVKLQGVDTLAHSPVISDLRYVPYPEGLKEVLRDKFVVSTGLFRQLDKKYYSDSLYICHGISDKESYHAAAAKAGFKFYASSGPRFTDLYKKYGVRDEQIIKCGYLRNEIQFVPYEDFDVLFAPTHGAGTILPYIDEIINFCETNNLSLKIRLHPLTETSVYNKCKAKIAPYLVSGDISTWSLLHVAKYVITDVSSISYESTLLGKPVMMVEGAPVWTQVSKQFSAKLGPVVTVSDTGANKIERCFNKMLSFAPVAKEELFYLNESPSQICVDFIQNYLGD